MSEVAEVAEEQFDATVKVVEARRAVVDLLSNLGRPVKKLSFSKQDRFHYALSRIVAKLENDTRIINVSAHDGSKSIYALARQEGSWYIYVRVYEGDSGKLSELGPVFAIPVDTTDLK